MNRRDARAEQSVAGAEAGGLHQPCQPRRVGKGQHALGQVGVGPGVAAHQCADARQDVAKVHPEQAAEHPPGRRRKFQDDQPSAGRQHPPELGQAALVVGEVAESEGAGQRLEAGVGVGQLEGVALLEPDIELPGLGLLGPIASICGTKSEAVTRVWGEWRLSSMAKSPVPVATSSSRAGRAAAPRRRRPPPASVDAETQHPVEQVVARRDVGEHPLHTLGLVLLVAHAGISARAGWGERGESGVMPGMIAGPAGANCRHSR